MKQPKNPYVNARRKWNDVLGGSRAFAQMSGLIALFSVIMSILAIYALHQQSSQFRTEVIVIEVDALGRPITSYEPTTRDAKDPNLIMADLAELVRDWRAVYADGTALRSNIDYVYSRMKKSSAAFKQINAFYIANDPFTKAADSLVSISDVSAIRNGDKTYQIEWRETATDRSGKPLDTGGFYRAVITIYQEDKIKIEDNGLSLNPLGVYIDSITWSKVK